MAMIKNMLFFYTSTIQLTGEFNVSSSYLISKKHSMSNKLYLNYICPDAKAK